ncbi:Uncharacterized protein dnl_40890 [Desulfonema limicola]|uniref:Single-stranded-DNA-specific exonuclease RecJ n=1 Tax=Desulfonema limicola TaxID=45656 RepID=A0A975BAS2_9BACT|nr:single-stranded-DNA-specific exonuclease RecJ [Desulfonema limicola]QTA81740.1 Uncharacterized protein dnl_40890 [Desulfonema limicola]
MEKNWQIIQPDSSSVERIRRILNCTYATAAVLVNRHIKTESEARNYINFSLNNIRPPFFIKDIDTAVKRITRAVIKHEKILIFGDYDADGITATAILLEFLQYTGADVSFYIPHRTKEGYDLQADHIFGHALANEIDLIITVDCGSSRHEAVDAAQKSGIDVIITDHHTIDNIPPAFAVVNPRRQDCTTGFDHLAGVGVAFALIICLRKHLRSIDFWKKLPEPNLKEYCDLVALGTVADMVPLIHENRILSKIGLDVINKGLRPGLKALVNVSGINENKAVTDDIAFRLAPRLNAAGRIDHANTAVELLTTRNIKRAHEIALSLDHMNKTRQAAEKRILEDILEYIKKNPDVLNKKTLILSHHNWHEGILGIAASKLVERFYRPVILISTKNGIGKGSGRSIPGINIYDSLSVCSSHLQRFGGHPMAAGLQIRENRIKIFANDFDAAVSSVCSPDDFAKTVNIDCELRFDDISHQLIDELESLHPFGEGNPEPLFMAKNIIVSSSRIVGKHHRSMVLRQAGNNSNKPIQAIRFNIDTDSIKTGSLEESYEQIAFRLRWNRWNGKKTIQIVIQEI